MVVMVNGTPKEVVQKLSITDLIRTLDLPTEGIAIALNGTVVLRKEHTNTTVQENDDIEIIRAVAGG
ncbi:MAG: sulfur carrier protein ThiS [Gemmatimonadota bacterium]|uniref:Thiamine biosynthesis protein ThiS n=1 Tax=marine metagenome TaxID=408172 RepID=A0A382F6H9_9ZZZZ|nr:sulfur carrier protein ThiS [Gemmatimonadota bacterium]